MRPTHQAYKIEDCCRMLSVLPLRTVVVCPLVVLSLLLPSGEIKLLLENIRPQQKTFQGGVWFLSACRDFQPTSYDLSKLSVTTVYHSCSVYGSKCSSLDCRSFSHEQLWGLTSSSCYTQIRDEATLVGISRLPMISSSTSRWVTSFK